MGMGSGFDRARVVARRQSDRRNPVHDAFVVRGSPIGIGVRQRCGSDNVGHDLCSAQCGGVEGRPSSRESQVGFVGQDA